MMTEILDWSGLTDPMMVIGFAPPLYPAYHSDQMAGKEGVGSWQFRKIKKASEEAGCKVKKSPLLYRNLRPQLLRHLRGHGLFRLCRRDSALGWRLSGRL